MMCDKLVYLTNSKKIRTVIRKSLTSTLFLLKRTKYSELSE